MCFFDLKTFEISFLFEIKFVDLQSVDLLDDMVPQQNLSEIFTNTSGGPQTLIF